MTDDLRIPKRLHFIWLGSPMPAHLAANLREWERLNPGWDAVLWDEHAIPPLDNMDLFEAARELVPADAVYQFQADLLRYEVLGMWGGFYADVDTRPLKPITPELEGHDVFAAMEDRTWVGNTFLGTVAGHPLFTEIVASIPANVRRNRGKRPNVLTGPKFLTPIWKRHRAYTAPTERFFPYSYSDVRNGTVPQTFGPEVTAIHTWHHTTTVMQNRKAQRARL